MRTHPKMPMPLTWHAKLAMSASMVAGVLLVCLVAGTTALCFEGVVRESFTYTLYRPEGHQGAVVNRSSGVFSVPKAEENAVNSTKFEVKNVARDEPSVSTIMSTYKLSSTVEPFSAPGFPGWAGPNGMMESRMQRLASEVSESDSSITVTTPMVCYSSDGAATGILKKTNTGVDYCFFTDGECIMPDGSTGRFVKNVCKPSNEDRSTLEIKNVVNSSASEVSVD